MSNSVMSQELRGLLSMLETTLAKQAFVDPATLQGGGMPPGGDPSMMGGDPSMMGGDPSMMGGDPSMMGGDPSMMGAPPPGDPSSAAMDPAMLQQMMGGGEGSPAVDPTTGAPIVAKKIDNSVLNYMLLRMMAHQMGIPQELLTMPKQEADQVQPAAGGGGGAPPGGGGGSPGAIAPVQPMQPAMPKQASVSPTLADVAAKNAGLAYMLQRSNRAQRNS